MDTKNIVKKHIESLNESSGNEEVIIALNRCLSSLDYEEVIRYRIHIIIEISKCNVEDYDAKTLQYCINILTGKSNR